MSDLSSFLSTRNKNGWSAQLWDGLIEAIGARLAPLEEQLGIQRDVTDAIIARGLTIIEDELAPIVAQADQILDESTASITAKLARFEAKVTGGTVLTSSSSSASLVIGGTINLTIAAADREFFANTPYVALSRASTTASWAVGKVNSFSRATGALALTLEQVTGPGGPYTDWIITSLPGATLIQKAYYEQTLALRQQVADDKTATTADRAAAQTAREGAETAAGASVAARTASQQVFADLRKAVAVPLVAPTDPQIGQLWWDGTIVRVYDGTGFVPTVTTSIGGRRFEQGTFGTSQDGIITVGGGFTAALVFVNGLLLREGTDYTAASPTITVLDPQEGDEYFVEAYLSTDTTDYDTKEQVSEKIEAALTDKAVRVDAAQVHSPAEQGQARANIGADILGGFRNKIINGDHAINQRGTSFAKAAGVRYGADRWRMVGIGSTLGYAVVDVASAVGLHDPANYLDLGLLKAPVYDVTGVTGDTNCAFIDQGIENVATLSGQQATLTYYVAEWPGVNPILKIGWRVFQYFSSSDIVVAAQGVDDVSSTLTKYSHTFTIPSVAGKTLASTNLLYVRLYFDTSPGSDTLVTPPAVGGQSGKVTVPHISLVAGDATAETDPFSPRHLQQELALCQRYYQTMTVIKGTGVANGENQKEWHWPEKRTTPSITVTNGSGLTVSSITASSCRAGSNATEFGAAVLAIDAEI